ncbi:hypothetical protein PTE_02760 [Photorhabdus khanii NC19]|uniref:Uncharacterized protein n=1 Tax=Photorhabdus khanii NC19 TaxID=1004151 RepID=W3V6Z3_9GAMM|nr:hypothetical protein PTE_02760 [Photorhabdus khanii NC19]
MLPLVSISTGSLVMRLMEAREQRIQNVREMVLAGLNSPVSKNSLDDIFVMAAKDLNV